MIFSNPLAQLAITAQRDGWAAGTASVDEIRKYAITLGWTESPTRRGDPPVSQLHPTTDADAQPNSLSARYGLGAQPLHTDGAHLERPPEFVVLMAEQPNTTPTLLFRGTHQLVSRSSSFPTVPWDALRGGMFLVDHWRDSFYAPARGAFLRYDPGCMAPCDQRAQQVVRFYEAALANATPHRWSTQNQVLVIHNWSVLHARAAVAPDDAGRVLTRVAFAAAAR